LLAEVIAMTPDAISDVLRVVRLKGAVFFRVEGRPPWVAEAPDGRAIISTTIPEAQHLLSYHIVTEGACWAALLDGPPIRLEAGDVIVFPHGDPHIVSSAPGMRGEPNPDLYRRPDDGILPFSFSTRATGTSDAHLVCGFLGCDARPFNPLLDTLPRLLHVRPDPAEGDGLLLQFGRLAVSEINGKGPGSEAVLARLSELMFVAVVRSHLRTLPPGQTGWLAGLRDPFVGRALGQLHARPAHPWTLTDLARVAGLSRSALADRFVQFIGTPPMQYLAQWRMQVAASMLAEGASVTTVAFEVGYGSEAAFSRAFKKLVGLPPVEWRRSQRAATGSSGVDPSCAIS
jgi:AraC-like DNA-binding protein